MLYVCVGDGLADVTPSPKLQLKTLPAKELLKKEIGLSPHIVSLLGTKDAVGNGCTETCLVTLSAQEPPLDKISFILNVVSFCELNNSFEGGVAPVKTFPFPKFQLKTSPVFITLVFVNPTNKGEQPDVGVAVKFTCGTGFTITLMVSFFGQAFKLTCNIALKVPRVL